MGQRITRASAVVFLRDSNCAVWEGGEGWVRELFALADGLDMFWNLSLGFGRLES